MPVEAQEKKALENSAAEDDAALWPSPRGFDAGHDAPVPWNWLAGLTLLAAVLRAIALDQQLWYDEITTLLGSVRNPLATILTTYTSQNQHTLYSILARGSIALFGEHPWTLRLPALLFGVASIPALYFCARLVASQREALLACALLTVSYHHVWFSQNARGYTAMLFWTLLATYFFIRGARPIRAREGGMRAWTGYGVAMALGMYTHLTMGFVAAGHALVCCSLLAARLHPRRRLMQSVLRPLAGFALAGVLTLLFYAPLLPQLFKRTLGPAGASVQSEWMSPRWMIQETLRGLSAGAGTAGIAAVAAGGLVLVCGLASYWRLSRHFVALMVLPGMVTAAVMLVLEHHLWPRFFFFALGFGVLLLVRGAMVCGEVAARLFPSLPQPARDQRGAWLGTGLVALLLAGSAILVPRAYVYPKQDFVGAMRFVEAKREPGEPVVAVGLASYAYQSYFRRDWPAVGTRAELDAARVPGRPTWLLYTFPIFVRSRHPEVWDAIQNEFTTVRVFRGTIGDGEIYVCKAAAQ